MTDFVNGLKSMSGLRKLTCEQSDFLHDAAEALERLSERCDAYKNQVKDGADTIARLSAETADARAKSQGYAEAYSKTVLEMEAAEARLAEAVELIRSLLPAVRDRGDMKRAAEFVNTIERHAKGASDAATGDKVSVPRQLVCDVIQIAGRNEDAQCIRDLADLVLPSSRRVG